MGKIGRVLARSALLMGVAVAAALPLHAASYTTLETVSYEWVDDVGTSDALISSSRPAIAIYGPFHVVDNRTVELIGSIESDAPALFARMLRAFPGITRMDMIECAGTGDDEANLKLARMVRHAGISTHVPAGGSVRSGGVELFLAGAHRSADPGAEFAVHSWMDEDGMQADDFALSDPVHQEYLQFYREMGMDQVKALAFYRLTNSAPFEQALYLQPKDIAAYIALN